MLGDRRSTGCRITLPRSIMEHTQPPVQMVLFVGIERLEMGLRPFFSELNCGPPVFHTPSYHDTSISRGIASLFHLKNSRFTVSFRIKAVRSFHTPGTALPATQCRIPKDRNPCLHL